MSIKAYVGRMGSGKTYEVVSVVILAALARGRRVITNIAGIDFGAMADLLVAEGVDADKIGRIVVVSHEHVQQGDFWLTETGNDKAKAGLADGSLQLDVPRILPGDLVALDEIWRFWGGFSVKDADGGKRPGEVMNFYRMHRHFTHPSTGVCCDVAIITQDVMDISRQVRAVIEETYSMEKLTAIGSTKRYRVDVCQGGQSRKVLRSLQREYNPKYFGLYSSHSGRKEGDADAQEVNIDQRGNILKGALFKIILPVGVLVLGVAVYTVTSFFKPKDKPAAVAKAGETKPVELSHAKPSVDLSNEWRVAGYFTNAAGVSVILKNAEQRTRVLHNPPNIKFTSAEVETFLPGGEAVASWTGAKSGGIVPGVK